MDTGQNAKDTKEYVVITNPTYHLFQFHSEGSNWYAICSLLNLVEIVFAFLKFYLPPPLPPPFLSYNTYLVVYTTWLHFSPK